MSVLMLDKNYNQRRRIEGLERSVVEIIRKFSRLVDLFEPLLEDYRHKKARRDRVKKVLAKIIPWRHKV